MKRLVGIFINQFITLITSVLLVILTGTSITLAQNPYQRVVRKFETPELGIPNPAGVVFSPDANAFLVAPASSTRDFRIVTFAADVVGNAAVTTSVPDPLNMAFDGKFKSLLFFDAGVEELVEVKARTNGRPDISPDATTRFNVKPFLAKYAKGMTLDPETGELFFLVVPSTNGVPRVVRVMPDPQARFDGLEAQRKRRIATIALKSLRGIELKGIAFNPYDRHLYIISPTEQKLYEITLDAEILTTRSLSELQLNDVQNIVFAPSGDQTDNPDIMNLYIVESGLSSSKTRTNTRVNRQLQQSTGDITELSLTQPVTLDFSSLTEQGTLIQTVLTSQWSPPSPDASGIAYIPYLNNLFVSDGEVNEMTIFAGVNVWQATLTGGQVQEFSTTAFSDEPTGIAFNPNNQHLFITDDTGSRSVYELDPGSDGLYGTSDDIVSSFSTSDFSSSDPEGITYDPFQGRLFMADGLNNEIYEISPGANGIFDGVSPSGDDIVTSFDTSILGINDPEGVEFNSDTGTLYVVGKSDGFDFVAETTTDGDPVNVIDFSSANARKPAGLAYAPSSLNPADRSLYIVARGVDNNSDPNENDGAMYEIFVGPATPTIFIDDVAVSEGNSGTVDAQFNVTLSAISQQTVTVDFTTSDGSALAGSDYNFVSGQVTFLSGETSQPIIVSINGDEIDEPDETFFVDLSNVVNAELGNNQGMGTIQNDDGPDPIVVSFQDGVNGYNDTRDAVLKSAAPTANYGSADELEFDGSPDESSILYWDVSGIPSGSTIQSADITVNVTNTSNADYELYEMKRPWVEGEATWNEYAFGQSWGIAGADGSADRGSTVLGALTGPNLGHILLSLNSAGVALIQSWVDNPSSNHGVISLDYINHSNGLDLSSREVLNIAERPKLTVTYVNNSGPTLSIDDVTVTEGNSGTVNANFTVTLSAGSSQTVTVNYATANGTATAGSDYVSASDQLTFTPGQTSQPVTVVVNGDVVDEPNETFFVNLTNPVNATISDAQGTGTITDDDGAPTLSVDDVTVTEGNSGTVNANFTVSLSATSAQTVTVDYATANGTATAGSDYVAASDQLTFTPGQTSQPVTVVVNGDVLDEPNETFFVNLTNPVNATISDAQGTGTITDDDGAPTLSIDDVTVTEGNSGTVNANFTVSLSATSAQTVTVDYATANGTATAGSDYVAASDQLTFTPGQTSQPVTVVVNGDVLDEPNETFFVNLTNPVNATISDAQGTGTITDDDGAPTLSIDDVTVTEGNSGTVNANFTVSLSATSAQTVTVDYATANGTATAGSDYVAASDQLTFTPGQTSQPVTVVVNGDVVDEPNETFFVNLTNPVNATISNAQGTGTITDDDGAPTLSVDDVTVTEGNSGTVNANFTVSLSATSAQTVTVDYATANGTATAGSDYVAASDQLTFTPGQTSQPVTVVVNGDVVDEPNETFFVNLTNPVNATISDAQGTGTITDDDAAGGEPVTVSFRDGVNGYTGTRDTKLMSQTPTTNFGTAPEMELDGSPDRSSVLRWDLSSIPSGSFVQTVDITVNVTNSSGNSYEIYEMKRPWVETQATWNEYAGGQSWQTAGADGSGDRGSTVLGIVTAPAKGLLTISLNTAGVTIVQSWIDNPGSNQGFVILDYINASNGLDFSSRENGIITNHPMLTVTYSGSGEPPAPTLSIDDVTVTEGNSGTVNANFTVTLSAGSSQTVTVNYATANGTATAGSDYVAASDQLTFTPGQTSQPVTVVVSGDVLDEPNETFFVNLSNPVNATISDAQGTGTITDDDGAPTLSVDDVTVTEGNSGTVNANFTVTLSAGSSQTVTVNYATANGTATAGSDYVAASDQLTFTPGQTSQPVTVVVNGDVLDEPNETFFVNLTNPVNATISDAQGTGTITDDDGAPTLSVDDVTVTEGNSGTVNANFTVSLSATSAQTVTVDYATANGTATAGSDYVAASDQLTFTPGQTSQPVTVVVNGDVVDEPNETFFVNLTNPVNATISDAQGTGTITDDDAAGGEPVTVSFRDGVNGYTGTRDTKLMSQTPTTNFGTAPEMELDGSPDRSSVLRWDLSSIPSGSFVQTVDITVNVTNSSGNSYEIYEMKRPWVETQATWNEYAGGQSWQTAGADGSGDRGSTVLGIVTAPAKGLLTISLNTAGVTIVQSWIDNPGSNQGFVILDYINASNGLDFSSREASTVAERPELAVTYIVPSGTSSNLALLSKSLNPSELPSVLPETVALQTGYPNPFNLETHIAYALPEPSHVRLTVYNVRGQVVRKLVDEIQPAGFKKVLWNGRNDFGREVVSGIYFIQLLVEHNRFVSKVSLLK